MTKKSQEESEQPAKVYQLDAIEARVKAVSEQMQTGFDTVNSSIRTLLVKAETQVTPQQLNDNILAIDKKFSDKLEEEIEKVHLEYKPIKENNKWLFRAVGGQAIVIVAQVIMMLYITGRG